MNQEDKRFILYMASSTVLGALIGRSGKGSEDGAIFDSINIAKELVRQLEKDEEDSSRKSTQHKAQPEKYKKETGTHDKDIQK